MKVECWGNCFVLGAVYRAPNSTPEFLIKLYDHVIKFKTQKIMLIGDFNLPGISWEPLCCDSSRNSEILFDIMVACDLSQIVRDCTRVTQSCCSILDLLFIGDYFDNYRVSVEEGVSDHKLVYFSCDVSRKDCRREVSVKTVKIFLWRKTKAY